MRHVERRCNDAGVWQFILRCSESVGRLNGPERT